MTIWPTNKRARFVAVSCCFGALCLLLIVATQAIAQDTDLTTIQEQAFQLFDEHKFNEAIPLLEKLVEARPNNIVLLERLGWATYVIGSTSKDPKERKQLRDRARGYLERCKKLGGDSELMRVALESLSRPDNGSAPFSSNPAAEAAMREGEYSYSHGDLDKAIGYYKRALELDPKIYYAALFIGDMYFKKGYTETSDSLKKQHMRTAGEWFMRAIKIDENVETAYRYWGDALMHVGEKEAAKGKFIEAIVAQPYDRSPYVGLTQWAEQYEITLAHPKIVQPQAAMTGSSEKEKSVITMDQKALDAADTYWTTYDFMRAAYKIKGFGTDYPDEKEYRHSLKEEASALRAVAERVATDLEKGELKNPGESLENLVKLYKADLIEPYVLFVRPDEGIARDYVAYRLANREKLKRYWADFVVQTGAGNFH